MSTTEPEGMPTFQQCVDLDTKISALDMMMARAMDPTVPMVIRRGLAEGVNKLRGQVQELLLRVWAGAGASRVHVDCNPDPKRPAIILQVSINIMQVAPECFGAGCAGLITPVVHQFIIETDTLGEAVRELVSQRGKVAA